MKNKVIYILRSCSHAGKSTVAKELIKGKSGIICTADDIFEDEQGNYNFDINKIGAAHKQCQDKFIEALNNPYLDTIVVANTSTTPREWKFYEEKGKEAGATIFFLIVERRHNNENNHKIPLEVLEKQENNLRNNLKLR